MNSNLVKKCAEIAKCIILIDNFNINVSMYMREATPGEQPEPVSGVLAATVAMALVFTIGIGVFPQPFMNLASQGAAHLRSMSWIL